MGKKKQSAGGKRNKKVLIWITVALLTAGLFFGVKVYNIVFGPAVTTGIDSQKYLYIPTGADYNSVVETLRSHGFVRDTAAFNWVAEKMHYPGQVKPGRYQLRRGMSNRELVSLLRSGRQTPLRLTFTNIRTVEQLAGIVGAKIEADSAAIAFLLKDEEAMKLKGFTGKNSLGMLIPDTYEMYWNTSAEEFVERMFKEYQSFWTAERLSKATQIGFSPAEVSVLASIVEQETRKNDEKPLVAGVYINRYHQGWHLEADPTLVYALGDFTVHRVLNEYKQIDSPYNTYMYGGLPPGPICMPSVSSIDAVLNYKRHSFMYFCAREDFSGYHAFASTYTQHQENARKFQRELNRRGIRN